MSNLVPDIEFVDDTNNEENASDKDESPRTPQLPKARKVRKPAAAVPPAKKRSTRTKTSEKPEKPAGVKKGPGRPRLNPTHAPVPRSGISKSQMTRIIILSSYMTNP